MCRASFNHDSLGFRVEGITRKADNITSGLGVLKLINVQSELPNIKTIAIKYRSKEGAKVLIGFSGIGDQNMGEVMPMVKEDHSPIDFLINIKGGARFAGKFDSKPGCLLEDSLVPL